MFARGMKLVYFLSGLVWVISVAGNENWPQWRGPAGNGISDSKNLPTTWSLEKNENIVWKTELPSWSGGTPIIWGDHIFVTSPSKKEGSQEAPATGGGKGKSKRDPGGENLMLLCLSKKDGKVRWQMQIDHGNLTYNKQNSSSPSPVTDGKIVWVVTGNGVVTAIDFDGKKLWTRDLQKDYG